MTHTIPNFEYTVYTPEHPTQQALVLMIHGFATRGDQLWGGTGWVRQYLRTGYTVIAVDLPYHGRGWLKDPSFSVAAKLPPGTAVQVGTLAPAPDGADTTDAMGALVEALTRLLDGLQESGNTTSQRHPVHVVGFSFGAHLGWDLAVAHPHLVASLVLGGLPLCDHLQDLKVLFDGGTIDDTETLQAFTSIISSSPIRQEALHRFVALSFAPFDPDAIRGGQRPHCPILMAVGTEDNVAADAHELYDMVASDNPQNELLLLPGRDHVNALTAGVFRRAALAFSQDSEAAAKV